MTREETIRTMIELAIELMKDERAYTRDNENEIWNYAYDWNSNHDESEEIFMCEHYSEDDEVLDGFYIEDDYFIYPEYIKNYQ